MRDHFELSCKVVGLVLICWGVIVALTMIPTYFHQPKADMFFPQSMLSGELGQSIQRTFDEAVPRMYAWITLQLFLQGIVPALLGVYLMRSNNLFVRRCYPKTSSPAGELQLDAAGRSAWPPSRPVDGAKFAPPGYGR